MNICSNMGCRLSTGSCQTPPDYRRCPLFRFTSCSLTVLEHVFALVRWVPATFQYRPHLVLLSSSCRLPVACFSSGCRSRVIVVSKIFGRVCRCKRMNMFAPPHDRRGTTMSQKANQTGVLTAAILAAMVSANAGAQPSLVSERVITLEEVFHTSRDEGENVDNPAIWHGSNGENWLLATAKEGNAILAYDAATGDYITRVEIGRASCRERVKMSELEDAYK